MVNQRAFKILGAILAVGSFTFAAEKPIDAQHSTIHIHVGKSGLFSVAGHDHWVTAPIANGTIEEAEAPHISFHVDAMKLTVDPDKDLSSAQQAEVQNTMQTRVLDSARFPGIDFRSISVEKTADGWNVRGDLALHGQTHSLSVPVRKAGNAYTGRCQIKQTDFGITPVTAGGGMVKVKNELQIEFSIVPANSAP